MQEIQPSRSPVVTGICDPNKSQAQHHHILKLGSNLKCLNIDPCHYFSSPGLSWDAMLKMTTIKLE